MLFDPRPKDEIKSLFGRDEEIAKLAEHIQRKSPLILITGFRRVGKTSLLKAVLNKYSKDSILIDLRDLGSKTYISKKDVIHLFESSIKSFFDLQRTKKDRFKVLLLAVRGITFPGGAGIQFDFSSQNELDFRGLFEKLDYFAKENKTQIVIAVDEAQEFRKSKHIDMNSIFASIYDNCKNIIIILTGSEIGVLYDFLALHKPSSPLFGRRAVEIEVKSLSPEQGIEFLVKGFKEQSIPVKSSDYDVITQAVEELGGIIGWLNQFGLNCTEHGKVNKKFILETKKTGSQLARSEFNKFLKSRQAFERYNIIMKGLSIKPMSWKDLSKYLDSETEEKIYDKNFADLLDNLEKSGFVHKIDDNYSIIDPLLEYSFERD